MTTKTSRSTEQAEKGAHPFGLVKGWAMGREPFAGSPEEGTCLVTLRLFVDRYFEQLPHEAAPRIKTFTL